MSFEFEGLLKSIEARLKLRFELPGYREEPLHGYLAWCFHKQTESRFVGTGDEISLRSETNANNGASVVSPCTAAKARTAAISLLHLK